ncbi:MAG: phosphoenolpyruvate synthase/pyruvate phosphate dikinase, partial [halophilic archaeon J07HX5]
KLHSRQRCRGRLRSEC